MRTTALLAVLGFLACSGPNRYETSPLESVSIMEDGLMLLVGPDSDPEYYCPGVNHRWLGDDLELTFVRARVGTLPPVSAKAQSVDGGQGKATIHLDTDHVAPGDWVTVWVAEQGVFQQLVSYQRPSHKALPGDRPPGNR